MQKVGQQVASLSFGTEENFENFTYVNLERKQAQGGLLSQICEFNESRQQYCINPILFFKEMANAAVKFLSENHNQLSIKDETTKKTQTFRTSWSVGAPFTVFFEDVERVLNKIELDIVPCILLTTEEVRYKDIQNILKKVENIFENQLYERSDQSEDSADELGSTVSDRSEGGKILSRLDECYAVCLHTAHSSKFQISFNNHERALLYKNNFLKFVIRMIKYVRKTHPGPLSKISSHAIKSVAMKMTIDDPNYWKDEFNQEDNFRLYT